MKNIYLETVDSTQNWAKAHLPELTDPFTCITALEQTAGRGRFNRPWLAPRGQNIYATVVFRVPRLCTYLANIGQMMAMACAELLQDRGIPAQLKWPNDILVQGKKIAGVLTESIPEESSIAILVGIGLNVNMDPALLRAISQPATSILELTGKTHDLAEVLQPLMGKFVSHLDLLKTAGFAPFHAKFETLLAFRGKTLTLRDGHQTLTGICQGITTGGYLKLLLPSGEVKIISSGEINYLSDL